MQYLRSNPQAADTLEGISQWWLRQTSPPPTRETVEAALELLVARGAVVRHENSDGVVIYRAARRAD